MINRNFPRFLILCGAEVISLVHYEQLNIYNMNLKGSLVIVRSEITCTVNT